MIKNGLYFCDWCGKKMGPYLGESIMKGQKDYHPKCHGFAMGGLIPHFAELVQEIDCEYFDRSVHRRSIPTGIYGETIAKTDKWGRITSVYYFELYHEQWQKIGNGSSRNIDAWWDKNPSRILRLGQGEFHFRE